MELNSFLRKVLVELQNVGFTGNWYQAFGKNKLRVYRNSIEGDENILVSFNETIEVDVQGINSFDLDAIKRLEKEFGLAIKMISEMYKSRLGN